MSNWTKTRSVLALTIKNDPTADTAALRSQLKAEHLEEYILKVVSTAPQLTPAQRDRISALLAPIGGDAA